MNNVFLSYANEDKPFVEKLALDLKKAGINVWAGFWNIAVGDSIIERIDAALSANDCLILVLSPRSVQSPRVQKEWNTLLMRRFAGEDVKILPVLYEDCKIPKLIEGIKPADFQTDYTAGLNDVLNAIQNKGIKISETSYQRDENYTSQLSSLRAISIQTIENKKAELLNRSSYNIGEFERDKEVGPTVFGTKGLARYFSRGLVICHYGKQTLKAFAVYGAIGHRFRQLADRWKEFGFPTEDEQDALRSPFGAEGRYSLFENGVIFWYSNGSYREQTLAISGQIARKYNTLGLSESYLGFPISEPYSIKDGKRCDFEGGAIVFLNSSESTQIVRQLLQISYLDTPFNHQWLQYAGTSDPDCLSVLLGTSIGRSKSYIAFHSPWGNKAIRFPDLGFQIGELREKYCGVTVKSLVPGARIRFYLHVKTNGRGDHYLAFDSEITQKEFVFDDSENVNYWRIPLPKISTDGEWHTYIIDLDSQIQEGFVKTYVSLMRFHFRGHVGIADLLVSDSQEALEALTINPVRI